MTLRQLRPCTLEGYWCQSPIRLARPVTTPLGGRVSVLTVCVNIRYSVQNGVIVLHGAELTQPKGTGLEGVNMLSQRRGEAFRATRVYPEEELLRVVRTDLCFAPSYLGRQLLKNWREANPDLKTPYLAEPFKVSVSSLPTGDQTEIGPCEVCGQIDLLANIESGDLVCQDCLQKIRAQ